MTSITAAIAKIKDDSQELLGEETIRKACRDVGYTWRNRILNPVALIRLFILQVLHGNIACQGLRHLSTLTFTATAYGRARSRLPLIVYQGLCRSFIEGLRSGTKQMAAAGDWLGHRVFRVDGTGISMPDTPELQRHFGQPPKMKTGCAQRETRSKQPGRSPPGHDRRSDGLDHRCHRLMLESSRCEFAR